MGFDVGVPVLLLMGRIVAIRFVVPDFIGYVFGCFGGFVFVGILDFYLY